MQSNTQGSAQPDMQVGLPNDMEDIEKLTHALKRLLVKHEHTLDEEGIRHEIETLERWMESYRHGLSAAGKIAGTGIGWLHGLRDRLTLAADEMHRLEGEGGNPAPAKDYDDRIDDLRRAARHIDQVLPGIEENFKPLAKKESV